MTGNYTFNTLYNQIKTQKYDFWRTSLYGIVTTLLLLPIPMLIPLLIDEVLLVHPGKMTEMISGVFGTSELWAYITVILTVVFTLRFLSFFFNSRKTLYATKISEKISYLLRHRILHHLERVSLADYQTLKSGAIASKTVQDVESVSGFAGQVVTTVLSAFLMLLGIAVIMLWMNWVLALLIFMLNPLFLGFSRLLGRKTGELLHRKHEVFTVLSVFGWKKNDRI